MWQEKQFGIRIVDKFGLERTLSVESTDLSIPNRRSIGSRLEDGLMPVSAQNVPKIIQTSAENSSPELALLIRLGFGTGMRIGTLTDLKVTTIRRSVPSVALIGFYCLAVGPGAHPPVATKFGVTGQVLIGEDDLDALHSYIHSPRRMKRQAIASEEHKDLVFLTRYGKPYSSTVGSGSRTINVELGRLRKKGISLGINVFHGFHFHQTRCTFATELARAAMKYLSLSEAISLVKGALLHKNEETTIKYIKFIENSASMSALANEFTQKFLGIDKQGGPANGI